MNAPPGRSGLEETLARARGHLLSQRVDGHWVGQLSSSALSTATAVIALTLADADARRRLIQAGLNWLADHANADGGWGDTTLSVSNISTTLLARAAFALTSGWHGLLASRVAPSPILPGNTAGESRRAGMPPEVLRADRWIAACCGGLEPEKIARAVNIRYGSDRTFSAPILAACALAGLLGRADRAWSLVAPLPFELAAVPHRCWRFLRLPVVSYALPALIALGQARHHFRPSPCPITRAVRSGLRRRTLAILRAIQPESGGFLEAAPLTSFVVMSLCAIGRRDHPVVAGGVDFIVRSARPDGSWPVDTNLATWVTTLAINAVAAGSTGVSPVGVGSTGVSPVGVGSTGVSPVPAARETPVGRMGKMPMPQEDTGQTPRLRRWLLDQQHRVEHPYTHARAGGWAWTDLSGGVPDADDTAGALLALRQLGPPDARTLAAARAGAAWLIDLQNSDGGLPTFCRGWGRLAFDRSSPDLTAHALRAWCAWLDELPERLQRRVRRGIARAVEYLRRSRRPDGSWVPLWFGNQSAPGRANPLYGTARVLLVLAELPAGLCPPQRQLARSALDFVLSAQNADGSWGGAPAVGGSIEETALAVEALAAWRAADADRQDQRLGQAADSGAAWLIARTDGGRTFEPAPIGFYFASLWYYERLYPIIFTVAALTRLLRLEPAREPRLTKEP